MKFGSTMDRKRDKARSTLERIADALGCSPTLFIEAADKPVYPDETGELLRLWAQFEDPASRCRALAAIRALAEADER